MSNRSRFRTLPRNRLRAQVLNVVSSLGATIQLLGYLMPFTYLLWSLKYGPKAGPNPWGATGLEWQTPSPPPTFNFEVTPIVTTGPYVYSAVEAEQDADGAAERARQQVLVAEAGREFENSELK